MREVPELTTKQTIEFLDLVAQMSSPTTIERRLGISKSEQQIYRRRLNVESQADARKLWKQLKDGHQQAQENFRVKETQKARDAEVVAQARLEEMSREKAIEKPVVEIDTKAIKAEDAERQRRFAESQATLAIPAEEWRLPMEGPKEARASAVEQFRRDVVYRGYSFCKSKYGATKAQVQFEAQRLGLTINWDLVKR